MEDRLKSLYYKYATKLILIVALAFIFRRILEMNPISFTGWTPQRIAIYFLISIPLYYFSTIVNARAWVSSVRFLDQNTISSEAGISIYLKSSIAKYIPGNIIEYLSRNILAKRFGWDQKSVAMSAVLEAFYLLFFIVLYIYATAKLFHVEISRFLNAPVEGFPMRVVLIGFLLVVFILQIPFLVKTPVIFKKILSKDFLRLNSWYAFAGFIQLAFLSLVILLPLLWLNELAQGKDYFEELLHLGSAYVTAYLVSGSPNYIDANGSHLAINLEGFFKKESILMTLFLYRIVSLSGDILCYIAGNFIEKQLIEENGNG